MVLMLTIKMTLLEPPPFGRADLEWKELIDSLVDDDTSYARAADELLDWVGANHQMEAMLIESRAKITRRRDVHSTGMNDKALKLVEERCAKTSYLPFVEGKKWVNAVKILALGALNRWDVVALRWSVKQAKRERVHVPVADLESWLRDFVK